MKKRFGISDDPRRVTHGLKVGITLCLLSVFYYCQSLYDSFGLYAMTATLIAVSVLEFSVGDTIKKGFNIGLATLIAGFLGVGVHYLANLSGQRAKPIILGLFLFLQGTITANIKLFPEIKVRYDSGLVAFCSAFCEISISGFRNDDILELTVKKIIITFIGSFACVGISIIAFPVWAGEDLHKKLALNLEELGNFLKAFEGEYFKTSEGGDNKSLLEGYKRILDSKRTHESLANSARWEPPHGKFRFRQPWSQYLTIGTLTHECAYGMKALYDQLNSNIQALPEIQCMIQEACSEMSLESSKALMELALAIKTMNNPSSAETHIANSKAARKSLKSLLKSSLLTQEERTVPSLLVKIVHDTKKIADSIKELASRARFRECAELDPVVDGPHVIIELTEEERRVPPLLSKIVHDTKKIADSIKKLVSRAHFRECAELDPVVDGPHVIIELTEEERTVPSLLIKIVHGTKKIACSALEGVGRTLKGRDLRQFCNAVWRQRGFLD